MKQLVANSERNGPSTAIGTLFIAALIVVGCAGSGTGGSTTGGTSTGGTTTGGTTTGGTTTGGTTGALGPMEIVYTSNASGTQHIYKANDDGTGVVQLTNDVAADNDPAWNRTTDMIAFVRAGQLMTMNSDGTGQTARGSIPGAFSGSFNPAGTQIVYATSSGVYVHTLATGIDELLVLPLAAGDSYFTPNYSRDGTKVYFVRFVSAGGSYELRRVSADGTGNVLIYASTSSMLAPFESSNGTKLFVSNGFLKRMDLDGSNVEDFTPRTSYAASMSSDGSRIIYFSGGPPDWDIYRMRADGTDDTKILDDDTALTYPRYPE